MRKTKSLIFFLLATLTTPVLSQQPEVKYEIEAQAIGTTDSAVPFWMRSNQFGSIPTDGASGSIIGRARKDYDSSRSGLFDWGVGFDGRVNMGRKTNFLLIEGYAKVKAGIFQLKAGRTKDVMGLNGDTSLTSGNFAVSGNALGVPKIELSIPEYWRLPILDGILSIKGNFSHGWIGHMSVRDTGYARRVTLIDRANTYFHQKSLYGRLGKSSWRTNLFAGINHQAQWGDEKKMYGKDYDITNFENFLYMVSGQTFNNGKIPGSKVGNHIGSIDFGVTYRFNKIDVMLYRQFFYDAGALGHLANIKDGLTGITLINKNPDNGNFYWKKILLEFLYSKNQGGELTSKPTPSGDDDYYNNYVYEKGWTYDDETLGNPLFTTVKYSRRNLNADPSDHFINNRIAGLHVGITNTWNKWDLITKLTYTNNFGTFKTSPIGNSRGGGKRSSPKYGIFGNKQQISYYFEGRRSLSNGFSTGYALSFDRGDLLYNSIGGIFRLTKRF